MTPQGPSSSGRADARGRRALGRTTLAAAFAASLVPWGGACGSEPEPSGASADGSIRTVAPPRPKSATGEAKGTAAVETEAATEQALQREPWPPLRLAESYHLTARDLDDDSVFSVEWRPGRLHKGGVVRGEIRVKPGSDGGPEAWLRGKGPVMAETRRADAEGRLGEALPEDPVAVDAPSRDYDAFWILPPPNGVAPGIEWSHEGQRGRVDAVRRDGLGVTLEADGPAPAGQAKLRGTVELGAGRPFPVRGEVTWLRADGERRLRLWDPRYADERVAVVLEDVRAAQLAQRQEVHHRMLDESQLRFMVKRGDAPVRIQVTLDSGETFEFELVPGRDTTLDLAGMRERAVAPGEELRVDG